jgi:two-component system, NarL family, sensor histidine kinase EvgS
LELDTKPLDIRTVIQAVVDANNLTATQKGLTLTFTKPESEIIHPLDEKRFFQIIQNLVTNAVKYTQKGGVDVTLEQTHFEISIRIKDTGMGISAEDQQKLFQPFARVGGVEKTNITGTGLGMWITRQMIALMNGSITVESIKGVGTHVVVTLKR